MNQKEIKQRIYEQNPTARLIYIQNSIAYYDAKIKIDGILPLTETIFFSVPVLYIGGLVLTPTMPATSLIEYITTFNEIPFNEL